MIELTAGHVDDSISRALDGESHLDPKALEVHGFATPTMRRMFSNLCNIDELKYLECGVYTGASFVAAYHGNPIHAIGIDNFCQTWHPERDIKGEFTANNFLFINGVTKSVRFFCDDCFNPALLPQIGAGVDVYFFDGDHTREAQGRALPHFFDVLSETFLFMVDDANWPDVADGTADGFHTLRDKVSIDKAWVLIGRQSQDDKIWHNGVLLYLCHKK